MTQFKTYYSEGVNFLKTYYSKHEAESLCLRLLEDGFSISRETLIISKDKDLNIDKEFYTALEKLADHCPIQYITGFQEFLGHNFKVSKDTLIPRPETEELTDFIIKQIPDNDQSINILDIGTGTGAIGISIALAHKNCKVTLADISEEALKIAQNNASILKANNVRTVKCDILNEDEREEKLSGTKWDIIVSNPPYIPNADKKNLDRSVSFYEPNIALFVDDKDPLVFYTAISKFAFKNQARSVFFEINENLGEETMEAMRQCGLKNITLYKDLFNKDRFLWSQM